MAALGWLTPRRRSATARSVLAGEASAEAARKTALAATDSVDPDSTDAAQPPGAPAIPADAAPLAPTSDTEDHVETRDEQDDEGREEYEEYEDGEPEFPVPGDDLAAAFFDLDNTVMQGAAIFHFGRGLYKREFFRRRELARFAWQQAWFRLAGVEDPEHMQDARDSALSIVKGHKVSELMAIGEEIYDEYMAERIWPGTRALAQAHLDAGQKVWLVTAAPVETATIIARRLGLTGALGTVAESVDGIYTGRLVGEPLHGPAKAEAVRALAAAEDLDLARCAAYSDSHNDIPMLSLVGHPYAINPDTKLRKHARAHDWRLRDYRTGRKAVKVGVPAAAGVGAIAGGAAAAIALHRRRK
ncbi:HAD-IB family hydrolase [Streptomyces sp. NBC_00249]|uniref:HAD family hydrolase n=1 Tax=Streptomyces sp. NBC_00249 TaxID=2975690 RepID=UPI00224C94BB|nr:HAD-IB family hydrolase [Streptomyces sp. NBC_00249]MCX5199144.1 HAD-IB family hydrolase [Streptomyces sp. NBC_00249]